MPLPATAGPRPSTDASDVSAVEGLRARIQQLEHVVRHALPALGYVADDPCEPAQRELLQEVIDDLRATLHRTGAPS